MVTGALEQREATVAAGKPSNSLKMKISALQSLYNVKFLHEERESILKQQQSKLPP